MVTSGAGLRLDDLAHVRVEQFVGHVESIARVQRLLRQEEAVLTVEVADRSGRFGEDVEVRRRDLAGRVGGSKGPWPRASSLRIERYRRSPSDPFDCLQPSCADRVGERLVVPLVLVCVALGEVGDRLIESILLAEVRGDRDRVA